MPGAAAVGGLTRNDQLLARRQRARPLVAVGLQDRGWRNIVAARQGLQRVAGADDDRGAALTGATGRRDRARRDAAGGLERTRRRRIGGEPRALRRTRRCWRPDRTAAPRSAAARPATGIAIAGGNIAAVRGVRPRGSAPSRWLPVARQRDWRRNFARGASTCRRCSRQNRTTSAPAPRRAVRGASKATRRHGTWLLTRTQQITVLSKHAPSKQPLNPAKDLTNRSPAAPGRGS